MTFNELNQNVSLPRKKRADYSRNGCLECKRMKVKCDEFKPSCSRCKRRAKNCFYRSANSKNTIKTQKNSQFPSIKSTTNLMDSIDHDISSKIEEILSMEFYNSMNHTLSSSVDTELYHVIDQNAFNLIHPYENLNKFISKNDDLLLNETVHLIPLEAFKSFNDLSHKCYFEIFYTKFSHILMPFESQNELNPVRDILLSYAFRKDYLYYAILASGARLSYKYTSLQDDQHFFSIFMKKTASMLDDFTLLQNYKQQNQSLEVVHEILEPLLLTILLLTSDNASSLEQTWRGHLRGAKELLHKVYIDKIFPETKILLFCKCWFTSFEILAGLGAPYGGTLISENEFEKLFVNMNSPYEMETLKALKIIDDQGFNCLVGFHSVLLAPLIDLSNQIRLKIKESYDPKIVLRLSREFQELNSITSDDDWKIVSHNSYANAGLLTIFSIFLDVSPNNLIVTGIVDHTLDSLLQTLSTCQGEPHKLLLLHWPILVTGLNSVSIEHRKNVEHLMNLLISLGTGAARHVLQLIKKRWNNELDDDNIDMVTY